MTRSYMVVDSFTDTPLSGNPVAVFFDAADLTAERMQAIAKEMNLSETTFVLPAREDGDYHIRIFTPVNELPFAGHPLLGTAVALGEFFEGDRLRLETKMGVIPFDLIREGGIVVAATMEQPTPTFSKFERAEELLAALGLESSPLPIEIYVNGPRHVFVALPTIEALAALHPDHRALAAFEDMATNCFAGSGTSWRSRMFSPAYGVQEDAATGSAAGPLAFHLGRHGRAGFGRWIEIHQGVEMGRPSLMRARADESGRTLVSGSAVPVVRGVMLV
ncbi:PhzF family phenazine biosynthesis protein [Sinosporangium siamense]|uniref:Trans-2,3-dihydro-3-hydroxyanthranilate isomerase n=1 Tax=Sinosporangium siamense TaxID=1367973 RepID=A0A919V9D5_9ACTN|nr:PhzF family phenazine biosynthesis isomerase [Sinosporangium siamense]GII90034.1 trans-2,3-dihydro-3-hydroxyanthranilate isomerase [Sinosporangium siamense]